MDPLEIVESTADAAFATDEEGRIVIWNKAAERLLGYRAEAVLGKSCHKVICGLDVFGNRFCDQDCNLARMVRRKEPIRGFELEVRQASGKRLRAVFSLLTVRGPRPSQFTLIHLLQPAEVREEAETLLERIRAGAPPRAAPSAAVAAPVEPPALTEREVEVLRLLADGASSREIADSLFISVTTVRTHVQNILRKLEVHSQLQAVSLALRNRLI